MGTPFLIPPVAQYLFVIFSETICYHLYFSMVLKPATGIYLSTLKRILTDQAMEY